jgi:hypothetical protein
MEPLERAMLSQFMSQKLISEGDATKILKALAEEGGAPPSLASVVSTINKELEAVGLAIEDTNNAPGGAKHYAMVDADPTSDQSTMPTVLVQPELEMFQKIVRSPCLSRAQSRTVVHKFEPRPFEPRHLGRWTRRSPTRRPGRST